MRLEDVLLAGFGSVSVSGNSNIVLEDVTGEITAGIIFLGNLNSTLEDVFATRFVPIVWELDSFVSSENDLNSNVQFELWTDSVV